MSHTGWPIRESEIERGVSRLLRENRAQLRRIEDAALDQAVAGLYDLDPEMGAAAVVLVADHRRRRAANDLAETARRRFWSLVERGTAGS